MKTGKTLSRIAALAIGGALALSSGTVLSETFKIGTPTFLTGAGAPDLGIPAKKGVELIVRGINNGELPAPYNSKGVGGRQIELLIYDEAGGGAKQVTELRNKVQKDNVDMIVGYISSGSCAAVTRPAEDLKILTILTVCGTPRVFEEINPDPKYVFRSMNNGTATNVTLAHYIADKFKDANGYVGLNQNYAWGQDSLRDFRLAMNVVAPQVKGAKKHQFPKLFSGQYGTEISALSRAREEIVHSSFWGGDLEAFIAQANARGLFKRKRFLLTVGETVAYRLGKSFPQGVIAGTRGPYGMYAVGDPSPLNQWFQTEYRKAYNEPPSQPGYQFAQGFIAAKYAIDKAAEAAGKFPTTDQIIAALKGATFPTFIGNVEMARSNGHQGITDDRWGVTVWDDAKGEMVVKDVVIYPASCGNPPDGINSVEWIKGGMKGAKC